MAITSNVYVYNQISFIKSVASPLVDNEECDNAIQ